MVAYGYTLSSEEHGPSDLVGNAQRAEELGFDFVSISDHFHPWVSAQGHSPFVWSVLGGDRGHDRADAGRRRRDLPDRSGSTRRSSPRPPPRRRCCSTAGSSSASAPARRSTSTSSATAGRRPRSAWRCWRRRSRSSAQLWTGETVDHRGELLRGRERPAVRPARPSRRRSSCRASGPRPSSWPPASATATGATRPSRELIDRYRDGRRHRSPLRPAQPVLGRGRGGRPQDRAPGLAQRRHPRPALPGPARPGPTSSRRPSWSPRTTPPSRCRAAPTSSRSSSRCASSSTPATTTSTSTRSAPTRTASSGFWTDEPPAGARRPRHLSNRGGGEAVSMSWIGISSGSASRLDRHFVLDRISSGSASRLDRHLVLIGISS